MFTVGQCPLVESWSALLQGARAMRAASVKIMVRVAHSGRRASSEGAVVHVQRAVKGLPAIANIPLPHRWPAVGKQENGPGVAVCEFNGPCVAAPAKDGTRQKTRARWRWHFDGPSNVPGWGSRPSVGDRLNIFWFSAIMHCIQITAGDWGGARCAVQCRVQCRDWHPFKLHRLAAQ